MQIMLIISANNADYHQSCTGLSWPTWASWSSCICIIMLICQWWSMMLNDDYKWNDQWSSSELHGSELANLSKLVELHLHNNRLRSIEKDTFSNLTSLQVNIIMVIIIITFVIITIKLFILIIFILFVFVVVPCFIPCQMAQSSSWWSVGGVDYRVSHKKLMLLLGSSGSAKRSQRHR